MTTDERPELTAAERVRVIRRLKSLRHGDHPNPFCDMSDPEIQDDERRILKRLVAGEELNVGRVMAPDGPDRVIYGTYFYWYNGITSEIEQDWAVLRLLGRQLVRPVRCAGGATWIQLAYLAGHDPAPADAAGLGRLAADLRDLAVALPLQLGEAMAADAVKLLTQAAAALAPEADR